MGYKSSLLSSKSQWFSGKIRACHARAPCSIHGCDNLLLDKSQHPYEHLLFLACPDSRSDNVRRSARLVFDGRCMPRCYRSDTRFWGTEPAPRVMSRACSLLENFFATGSSCLALISLIVESLMQTGDIAARKRPMLSFVQPISVHEYLSYLPDQWFLHRVSEHAWVHLRLQPAKCLQTSDHGPRTTVVP
jgi:hypothetical protein